MGGGNWIVDLVRYTACTGAAFICTGVQGHGNYTVRKLMAHILSLNVQY